ncbi:unnamed protein product [Rotaria socialis]|uniref:Histone-lysine N-methyltransferase n=1 Tax=Rotaria socialis TaxID=392032 RepID=A0A821QBI7_9BILA|nr:unnamed protein product [Rotaria socialis]
MGNVIKRLKGPAQNISQHQHMQSGPPLVQIQLQVPRGGGPSYQNNASIPPVFSQGPYSLPMNQNQGSYESNIFLSNTTDWSINDIQRLRAEFASYANPNDMSNIDQDDGLEAFRLALANQAPDNSATKQEKRAELRSRFLNVLEYIKSNKNISPIQLDFHRESSLIAAHCLSIDSNFSQVLVQDLQTFIGHIPTALYIDSCLIQATDEEQEDEQYDGCSCSLNDTCAECSCSNRFGINYNSLNCLNINKTGPVFECNSECRCSFELCQNRVSQKDDQCNNVEIISTPNKGSGVISRKSILHPGTYIGEYVGEVLSENEAHRRILATENYEHNYLLLYNEHQSGKIIKTFIDARYYGNWTRFINHSCNPNLHIVPIRIDQPTPPRLAFFTLREVQDNEELSYSYGTMIDEKHSKPCHCSSSSCTGFMPYQQTD